MDNMLKYSFFLVFLLFELSISVDYCKLDCDHGKHTMCLFQKPGPGPQCEGYMKHPITAEEKQIIIDHHNFLRNKVAEGSQPPHPSAANMMQLEWDEELSTIAQRWADQCDGGHDECRNSERFHVGQNYAASSTTGKNIDVKGVIKEMIDDWYSEFYDCPVGQIEKYTDKGVGGNDIGHYTQLVWAETSKIGCGLTLTFDGEWTEVTLLCNYGPTGNFRNHPVYSIGKKCSACPAKTKCSSKYNALCA